MTSPASTPHPLRLARRWFGRAAADRVFEPLIADWQRELAEAPNRRRAATAFARGALAFLATAARCTGLALASREMLPAVGIGVLFAILGTALLALPFAVVNFARLPPALWPLILPSLAAFAVPIAVLPAALTLGAAARADDVALHRLRTVALAAVLVPALLGCLGWVVPSANQAWRVEVAAISGRQGPPRSLRELPLHELTSAEAVATYGDAARSELRRRLLIPLFWPPLLAMLGWHLGRHRGRASAAALTGYWFLPALTLTVVSYAPKAGFVFESPGLVCAAVWAGMIALLRLARGNELTPLTSAD